MSNAVRSPLRLLIGASILLTALFAAFVLRAHGSGVDATTIAPVLDRAPVASDAIPQDTLAAEQRFGEALDASTSRRIAFGALSEWIVQSSSGDLCTVSTLSADPGSVRWGCSKPSADNSAFVSLSVTPLTSPAATTWRGVISGLAAANVSSIEVIHVDGTISTLGPNADHGFEFDATGTSLSSTPATIEALDSQGKVLGTIDYSASPTQ